MQCHCYWLGEVPYASAWAIQRRLARQVASGAHPPTLLLLTHPPTFTFGRQGKLAHLLWGEEGARQRGVEVVWSDRGGDVTYHGPGQVVGYPILPLGKPAPDAQGRPRLPQGDYVGYLRRLEDVLIRVLEVFGVRGFRMEGMTGVWVRLPSEEPAKIAAIGVRVDARGVSQHGFALNVATAREHWDGIIGCGLKGYAVANLADFLQPPPAVETVANAVAEAFAAAFDCEGMRCEPAPDGII